jgi:hypothetical protein
MGEIAPLWIRWPYARIRRELDIDHGEIQYFLAQLEYDIQATPTGENKSKWRAVARFDHNSDPERGHDIREQGLHLDVFRDGEKYRVETSFPSVPLTIAPEVCQDYLVEHADRYLEQFERWHDLYGPWRTHSSE